MWLEQSGKKMSVMLWFSTDVYVLLAEEAGRFEIE